MLRLASCIVFQNPKDSKILFVKRKESELWVLPGGKLEDYESHYIHCFSFSGKCKKPNVEYGIVSDAVALILQDEITIAGFLHAAIREGEEETGLVPVSQQITSPVPFTVYSAQPIYCGATHFLNSKGKKEKDFFTCTFYCSQFIESPPREELELRWENPEFLLSSEIFVSDYNQIVHNIIKGLTDAK